MNSNPSPNPPEPAEIRAATAEIARDSLLMARKAFAWAFLGTVIVVILLIIATVVMLLIIATGDDPALDKSLIARLLQIAYGMVAGSACLFLGSTLAWFGINASFALSGEVGGNTKLALSSASPGIALIVGGLILIGITLYRPIDYFEDTSAQLQPAVPDSSQ